MHAKQIVVACSVAGMAMSSPGCASNSQPLPAGDAAVEVSGSDQANEGLYIVLPDVGGGPRCVDPVARSCGATTVRYYFDQKLRKCAETDGCEATENTFATIQDCETTCIEYLRCSCAPEPGACDREGLCGNCPSPDVFVDFHDNATGLACLDPGLHCDIIMTSVSGSSVWGCTCMAGDGGTAVWSCGIII
jgi:hypothetical protein